MRLKSIAPQIVTELGLAQGPLQGREEMRHGLGIVTDVAAVAGTAAVSCVLIRNSLPRPDTSISLAKHRGRFQDRKIGRNRLYHFPRECRVVKGASERLRRGLQRCVLVIPV